MNRIPSRPQRALCRLLASLVVLAFGVQATELDAAAQARLGLRVVRLASLQVAPTEQATAEVIDPGSLVADLDQVAVAQAASDASDAEYQRTAALLAANGNASRKALQAAHAQAVADQARLRQARMQLRVAGGSAFAALSPAGQRQWAEHLGSGRTVLLRAEPLAATSPFTATRAALLRPGQASVSARVLGPFPSSRSGLGGGWLLAADDGSLVPGMVMTAQLHGDGRPRVGVLLPRSGVVRWNGIAWAYVVTDATHFERRAVSAALRTDGGWLVGAPFKAGERVVTQGVEALIAVDAAPVHAPAQAEPADDD